MAEEHALPLAGIRVVEFTHMVMGPTCGMVLADLGAEVIKVEPLAGDNTRRLLGSGAGFFADVQPQQAEPGGGREGPARPRDRAEAGGQRRRLQRELQGRHDGRAGPRVPAALQALNPRLIYVSHKGFLPGPYEHRTALDEVVQMMGGLAYMTGPEGRPLRAGTQRQRHHGRHVRRHRRAGRAVRSARRTGRGQQVQSALFENNVFLVAQHMMQFAVTGQPAAPMPSRITAWGIYDVFTVAGGEQIFLAVVSDTQWALFCNAFGLPTCRPTRGWPATTCACRRATG